MPTTTEAERHSEPGSEPENPKRQQLLKATMECVSEVGVEKTTVWMVAERAGVSTGMVLYYFRNKKDLINAAVEWAAKAFNSQLNQLTEGSYGPERLKESMRLILLDPTGAIPANFIIQYRMAALNDEEIRQRSRKQYERSRISLARSVKAAQEHGQIRPDVADLAIADFVYTLANGLAAEVAAHPEIMSLERAIAIAQLGLDILASPDSGSAQSAAVFGAQDTDAASAARDVNESTADQVERLLAQDGKLSAGTAAGLAGAFRSLYEIAVRESANS